MMAAMLHRERRILAVCGDGGFMMNSQELETAARLELNLVVLVLQDNAYGMIRWKQVVDGYSDFGLTFGNPNFVTYAKAYGVKGSKVDSPNDLVTTLKAPLLAVSISPLRPGARSLPSRRKHGLKPHPRIQALRAILFNFANESCDPTYFEFGGCHVLPPPGRVARLAGRWRAPPSQ
jgi:hypothetical protein